MPAIRVKHGKKFSVIIAGSKKHKQVKQQNSHEIKGKEENEKKKERRREGEKERRREGEKERRREGEKGEKERRERRREGEKVRRREGREGEKERRREGEKGRRREGEKEVEKSSKAMQGEARHGHPAPTAGSHFMAREGLDAALEALVIAEEASSRSRRIAGASDLMPDVASARPPPASTTLSSFLASSTSSSIFSNPILSSKTAVNNTGRKSSVHSHAPAWLKWMRNGSRMLDSTMEKLKDDSQTIERKMMDAAKRLNQGLQAFVNRKFELTPEEIVGILDILRIVVIPNIEGRIKTVKRIITEIKTSGVQEYKEFFDSPSRDLFFYESELEKRNSQLEASSKDIVMLSRRLIEEKKTQTDDSHRTRKLTVSLLHAGSHSKLDSPSNKTKMNAFDAEKILFLLQSQKASDKLLGIQAINNHLLLSCDSARMENFLQELFSCLSNNNSLVRKSVLDLIPDLLHSKPVTLHHFSEDQNLSQEEKSVIEQNIFDQNIVQKCLQTLSHLGLEMRQSLISLLGSVVWSKDLESLNRMYDFLEDPSPYVRKTTITSLSKIVFPDGCIETFHRTLQLHNDEEWLVRVELCSALPRMAGFVTDENKSHAKEAGGGHEANLGINDSYNVFDNDLDFPAHSPSAKSERSARVKMSSPDRLDKDKMKKKLLEILERMLHDDSWNVRRAAVKVYASFAHQGKRTTQTLIPLCQDQKLQVCKTAFERIPRTTSLKISDFNYTVLELLSILVSNMRDSRSKGRNFKLIFSVCTDLKRWQI
eukprot:764091-Hanusia_phi.AAC.24